MKNFANVFGIVALLLAFALPSYGEAVDGHRTYSTAKIVYGSTHTIEPTFSLIVGKVEEDTFIGNSFGAGLMTYPRADIKLKVGVRYSELQGSLEGDRADLSLVDVDLQPHYVVNDWFEIYGKGYLTMYGELETIRGYRGPGTVQGGSAMQQGLGLGGLVNINATFLSLHWEKGSISYHQGHGRETSSRVATFGFRI